MAARVLIVSPIASHPQNQGNSARIYSVGRMLQGAGIIVHFLYYQAEGLTIEQNAEMTACWDYFHPVPVIERDASATGIDAYNLDDWWPPVVGDIAVALHKRWRFQAVIANYVWFSGVLEAFGSDVVKVLDTHDQFGGRADRFLQVGMKPAWYYTTHDEEARGLRRADIVLAIQDEEAAAFRSLGHQDVRVLGHVLELRVRNPGSRGGDRIAGGFLASSNPLNVLSFERMRMRLLASGNIPMHLVVGGAICAKLPPNPIPFQALGYIDHLDDFYDAIDIAVNPMAFGTGLKIKSVEAIFEGIPLIATSCAMTGLPVLHRLHDLASPEDVADALVDFDMRELPSIMHASRQCANEYAQEVRAACRDLVRSLRGEGPHE